MALEEKIETLTKEMVLLRQAIEKNDTAAGTKAAETAKPTAKKAPAKKKAEPEHDEDEVGSIFRKAAKKDKPACLKFLKKNDCDDLAELLTQPELFDAAYEFAEGILEAEDEDDD